MNTKMTDLIKALGHDADGFNDHIGDLEHLGSLEEAIRWVMAWELMQQLGNEPADYMRALERDAARLAGNCQVWAEVERAQDMLNEELGLDPSDNVPWGLPAFYMRLEDFQAAWKPDGKVLLSGDMLTERPEGPCVELYPDGWHAEGAPARSDRWMESAPDYHGLTTPTECQEAVDARCREAGTDADPAYASHGPMVAFSPVRALA